jgi:hypothetical protein
VKYPVEAKRYLKFCYLKGITKKRPKVEPLPPPEPEKEKQQPGIFQRYVITLYFSYNSYGVIQWYIFVPLIIMVCDSYVCCIHSLQMVLNSIAGPAPQQQQRAPQ